MPMRQPAASVTLLSFVALAGVAMLGALLSLVPTSGLHCSRPGARVVLDPGHGGDDPGATNDAAGLVERDLNLIIAQRAARLLNDTGYSVALTRGDDATGYANTPRGTIANLCHGFVYVSVHLNSFGKPEPNYAKTFWGAEGKDGAFAAVMQEALVARLQPGTDLGDSGLEQLENGGLLTARMPAVLVEPVFLSHPEEAARLADPSGARIDAIAQAIADGVDTWLRARGLAPSVPTVSHAFVMTPSDALLGPPRGSAAQIIAVPMVAAASRPDDLRTYLAEVYRLAPQVGLDPAIVVAQSALETGWWQSAAWTDHLNPAGIGVTGPGVASPSWQNGADAARAQLVHLYLYAVGPIPAGHPLSPYVPLDPRYEAALSADRAGSARHIADLSGRWAADPHYGEKIARVGASLLGD
jgi:N-acetylmuramoyl-L-alanine amidase